MIIVPAAQGSDEWRAARAGVITASMVSVVRKKVNCLTHQQELFVAAVLAGKSEKESMICAGYKAKPRSESIERAIAGEVIGEYSDAAQDYAFRLAIERISGQPLDEGFETWAMKRGHELEEDARKAHQCHAGVLVEKCGLVLTDDGVFGSSADGFISTDGGVEYKCLVDPTRLRRIWIDGNISEFMDQIQTGLWITGRKYWHFALYCPALAPAGKEIWWREIPRDDTYIEHMEKDLLEFKSLVDKNEAILRSNTIH